MLIHGYDTDLIMKDWNKLKMPKPFNIPVFNLEKLFTHDYNIYMSIREEGKSTCFLILGLILYKEYGTITEYVRNDKSKTTVGNITSLFKTILQFDYISGIYDGKYNDVRYDRNSKQFYLIHRTNEGAIDKEDLEGFCRVKSNEQWQDYKGYGSAKSNFILVDEFLDTNRATFGITQELFNNISTFGRSREECFVVMLSNTVNMYAYIWEDFCISDKVTFMTFGDKLDIVTELGTSIYLELMKVSERKKENLLKKKIRFFGFSNPKFANFTGIKAWQGFNYKHIIGTPKNQKIIAFIYHRGRYIALYYFEMDGIKPGILLTKFDKPKKQTMTFTICPEHYNEKLFKECPKFIAKCFKEDRFYFASNEIGMLFDDFLVDNGMRKIRK